jgi:hypothetical protein
MKNIFAKHFAMVAVMLIVVAKVSSQGFYVSAGLGYGLSAVPNNMGQEVNSTQTFTHTYTWNGATNDFDLAQEGTFNSKSIKSTGSYGKGFQAAATVGYMFTENIGAELGIGYLVGAKLNTYKEEINNTKITNHFDLITPANNTTVTELSNSISEKNSSSQMLRFIPAIRITAGKGKVKPYLKLGLVVGLTTKYKSTSVNNFTNNGVLKITEQENKITGGVSLGFAGGLGVNYTISNNLGIFAEFGLITQNWSPRKTEFTKYTIDGVDQLPGLTTSSKESEYENDYTINYSNISTDEPGKILKIHLPFSSVAISVGVTYAFGGK